MSLYYLVSFHGYECLIFQHTGSGGKSGGSVIQVVKPFLPVPVFFANSGRIGYFSNSATAVVFQSLRLNEALWFLARAFDSFPDVVAPIQEDFQGGGGKLCIVFCRILQVLEPSLSSYDDVSDMC